jgi:hypothetical protein
VLVLGGLVSRYTTRIGRDQHLARPELGAAL